MRILTLLFVASIMLLSCGREKTERYVKMHVYCDSCLVRATVNGSTEEFILTVDTAHLPWVTRDGWYKDTKADAGSELMLYARPLRMSDTSTIAWIRIDDVPSGFEFAHPDTEVVVTTRVPAEP